MLQQAGAPLDSAALFADIQRVATPAGSARAYVEVHIEQGPVLERVGAPLGAVSAIAGQTRLLVSVTGEQGHAGTVPMDVRRDAMAGAADIIVAMERRCRGESVACVHDLVARFSSYRAPDCLENDPDDGLVCTVGHVALWPGASNVIAGEANFTVDIRSRSDPVRLGACLSAAKGSYSRAESPGTHSHCRCCSGRDHERS